MLINKGPDVNFLFDLSKSMLVLPESNKNVAFLIYFLRYQLPKWRFFHQITDFLLI
jgi:hypothetical protein